MQSYSLFLTIGKAISYSFGIYHMNIPVQTEPLIHPEYSDKHSSNENVGEMSYKRK